jgi:hypothetical protein
MLLDISSWWQGLQGFEKILWGIALIFSALFLLQTLISLFGGEGDAESGHADDYVGDDDGVNYQFFTIKNFVAFFTMFGWVGLAAYSSNMGKTVSILLALLGGAVMVFIMALLFKNVGKLKESGTMQIQNAVRQIGETYLFIPAKRSGFGKVHVKVQGSLHELQAMTDDETDISTGRPVKVVGIINDNILLVTANIS